MKNNINDDWYIIMEKIKHLQIYDTNKLLINKKPNHSNIYVKKLYLRPTL